MRNERKHVKSRSSGWSLHPQALLRYVLALDDGPHYIALGAAIGVGIGVTPTPGLQMVLVLAIHYLCRPLLRFSLPAGLAAVYVSNPITALPLAWVEYVIGRYFVGGELTKAELAALMNGGNADGWWQNLTSLATELGYAYLIGSLIFAVIGACLTYPVMRYLIYLFRSGTPALQSTHPDSASQSESSRNTPCQAG